MEFARLRRLVASVTVPRWGDGGIRLAVDVCNWLRPEAQTSPGRLFCHVHGRGKNAGQVIPGWPYSFVAALGPGASSWAPLLDAARLGPGDDETGVTAAQVRQVAGELIAAGQWAEGDPDIIIALDAGFNVTRLAHLLADLPVVLVARVRSNRVFYGPPPPKDPRKPGKPAKHGTAVAGADPATQHDPALRQDGMTRTGRVQVAAWPRMHQMVHKNCGGWENHQGQFPVIEGTLIRLISQGAGEPMWLWASDPAAGEEGVRGLWQAYLRRFDIEHVFRFLKQQLGWNTPLLRDPEAADRWTWLIIACWTQLYLARPLAADIRLPWQRPQPPQAMTPGRVRAGFRRVRQTAGTPASPKKPSAPGPGRPPGSRNKAKAPRFPVGKTRLKKRTLADKARKQAKQARKRNQPTG